MRARTLRAMPMSRAASPSRCHAPLATRQTKPNAPPVQHVVRAHQEKSTGMAVRNYFRPSRGLRPALAGVNVLLERPDGGSLQHGGNVPCSSVRSSPAPPRSRLLSPCRPCRRLSGRRGQIHRHRRQDGADRRQWHDPLHLRQGHQWRRQERLQRRLRRQLAAADGRSRCRARRRLHRCGPATDGTKMWAYKGWPLYYWYEDMAAGDVKGDGVGGVWHLAVE
jgi:hypothetical protein